MDFLDMYILTCSFSLYDSDSLQLSKFIVNFLKFLFAFCLHCQCKAFFMLLENKQFNVGNYICNVYIKINLDIINNVQFMLCTHQRSMLLSKRACRHQEGRCTAVHDKLNTTCRSAHNSSTGHELRLL